MNTDVSAAGSRLLAGLNEAQARAVTTTDGPLLIVAGPGSGKTRVLTHRVAYLIEACHVPPWHILAVTFTNKAAREMRNRLEALVGLERARQLTVGTFHATCARILRRDGGYLGLDPRFTIYDDGDQMEAVRQALKQLNIDPKQESPRPILSRISAAKSKFLTPEEVAQQALSYRDEIVARVYSLYQETLRRNKALDFDDLLGETLRLFTEHPEVLKRYQDRFEYVLVDEYQDTNHVQYLLVRALAGGRRNLCVVGDPDQSIYGWRQADIRNILDFKRDYPDAQEIHLELNYRSTASIVQAADAVIRANTERIDRRLRTDNPTGDRIVLRESFDEGQEAQFVIGEVRRLTQTGGYRLRDIAVMYRTNAQSRALEDGLVRAGIPYQIIGATRFYERREIKDALALLRLIANPDDAVSFERVIRNTPLGKGIGARTLEEVSRWSALTGRPLSAGLAALTGESDAAAPEVGGRAAKLLGTVYRIIDELSFKSRTQTLSSLFDDALTMTGFAAQFTDTHDPETLDRWENVQQLRAVLVGYDDIENADALQTFLEEAALVADADTLDESGDQVTLITLHTAKGLEYPVVFVVGVEEGILPHVRSMESEHELEEERRLFYVGLTRAKRRLYVTYAFRRTMWGRSDLSVRSRFIESIPPDLLEDPATHGGRQQGAVRSGGTAAGQMPRQPTRVAVTNQPAPPPPVEPLAAGMRVFHQRFGDGVIVDVKPSGGDQEVTIDFKRHGRKHLMASYANLTID